MLPYMRKRPSASRSERLPWREGNRFEILVDGPVFFPRMLAAIAAARRYVFLEMYLVSSGDVATRFIEALIRAADRGIPVHVLLDDFGADGLKAHDRARLAHPNIRLAYYNPLSSRNPFYHVYRIFWRRAAQDLHRNHRKLLLIDGELAFVGGAGIADQFDPPVAPQTCWRETMLAVQGASVGDWQQLFKDTWLDCTSSPIGTALADAPVIPDGAMGRVSMSDAHHRRDLQRSVIRKIRRSKRRVWFATAYFVPSWRLRRNLKLAARHGVDVRLLLPGPITDLPGVRHASRRYYGRLLKNGVRIFEYQTRFLHAKTVLCDEWVTIGSSNFDRWNLQWNLEANQEANDAALADEVATMFEQDFSVAHEYSEDEWQRRRWSLRVLEWVWRQVELITLKITARRRR